MTSLASAGGCAARSLHGTMISPAIQLDQGYLT